MKRTSTTEHRFEITPDELRTIIIEYINDKASIGVLNSEIAFTVSPGDFAEFNGVVIVAKR
jgi:hypothetical protein